MSKQKSCRCWSPVKKRTHDSWPVTQRLSFQHARAHTHTQTHTRHFIQRIRVLLLLFKQIKTQNYNRRIVSSCHQQQQINVLFNDINSIIRLFPLRSGFRGGGGGWATMLTDEQPQATFTFQMTDISQRLYDGKHALHMLFTLLLLQRLWTPTQSRFSPPCWQKHRVQVKSLNIPLSVQQREELNAPFNVRNNFQPSFGGPSQ